VRCWVLRALLYCAELGFAKYFLKNQLPVLEGMMFFCEDVECRCVARHLMTFRHHFLTDLGRWGGDRVHFVMSSRLKKHDLMSWTRSRDQNVDVATSFLTKFLRGLRRGNLSQVQNHPVVTEVTGECC